MPVFLKKFLPIALVVTLSSCTGFRENKRTAQTTHNAPGEGLSQNGFQKSSISVRGDSLHFLESAREEAPLVILIHGAPGSAEDFLPLLADNELKNRTHLIAIDRPGYGESNSGEAILDLKEQAAFIAPLIRRNQTPQKTIVVGHSFGGALATQLAIDFPEWVDGLVLVSPVIEPHSEKISWYQRVALWPGIQQLLPNTLHNANREIITLGHELEKQARALRFITQPTLILHGKKDSIAPIRNVDYAQKKFFNAELTVSRKPHLDHYIPSKHPELIKSAILQHLSPDSQTPSEALAFSQSH